MKTLRSCRESGFSLLELMVVVTIIAILAAIALPQFAAYRKQGYQAAVRSDLKNAATAQEAYYAAHDRYQGETPLTATNLPGFARTDPVNVSVVVPSPSQFRLTATHVNCGATTWSYDSLIGVVTNPGCP